jgi:5-methylcytosine-specific restriction enzyme subunit McrC
LKPRRFDELDAVGETIDLDDHRASLLANTGLVEVRPDGHDRYRLLPRAGQVGAVRVGDLQVEVRPKDKIGVAHLLFLLGYTKDPGFDPDLDRIIGTKDDELWPALGHSLARSVDRALAHGVLQGYQTLEESLRTIRGRIRFGDQISRRPGLLVPIEVTYDEFSVDTPENQILLAALTLMLCVPRLDDDARRRMLHLSARLEGVSRLSPGQLLPQWQPTRLNERYHSALHLAEIVLAHASTKSAEHGVEVAAFVVTMWKVFEDFVTVALTEALQGRPGYVEPQLKAWLTGGGAWDEGRTGEVEMAVDLAHLDQSRRPDVVFDAKYKFASPTGQYANADHYQMLAYCTALGVRTAWLIYAAGAGSNVAREVKNTGIRIVEAPLDLGRSPKELLEQVDDLADRAMASRPLTDGA